MSQDLRAFIEGHRDDITEVFAAYDDDDWPPGPDRRSWCDAMLSALSVALTIPADDFGLERGDTQLARDHGAARRASGADLAPLIRDFAAFCDAICRVAGDENALLIPTDVQAFNLFVDGSIAAALAPADAANPLRTGDHRPEVSWVVEIGNAAAVVRLAFTSLRSGQVGIHSRTAEMLDRSLARIEHLIATAMQGLIDRKAPGGGDPVS